MQEVHMPGPNPSMPSLVGKLTAKQGSKSFALPDTEKQAIASSLAPMILDAIKESGKTLTPVEVDQLKTGIAKGLSVHIPGFAGNAAQVSGSVAGSISVDW
jgi:hypothetical protein